MVYKDVAYKGMGYKVVPYTVMADTVKAYIVMAYIVTASSPVGVDLSGARHFSVVVKLERRVDRSHGEVHEEDSEPRVQPARHDALRRPRRAERDAARAADVDRDAPLRRGRVRPQHDAVVRACARRAVAAGGHIRRSEVPRRRDACVLPRSRPDIYRHL